MPSPKVKTAVSGKNVVAPVYSGRESTVRFSTVPTDPDLARAQEDMRAAGGPGGGGNSESPFRHGNLVEFDFAEGLEQIRPHNLGGPCKGFIVVDLIRSSAATEVSIYRSEFDSGANPVNAGQTNSHIALRATDVCQATVWVWK
jgi:hypothetical protein